MKIKMVLMWFTKLLGSRPEDEKFKQFISEYDLSSDEPEGASVRWYENAKTGVSVYIHHGKIDAIQLFSAEHPDFDGFPEELPLGLDFEMTRESVHKKMGDPDHVTEARHISQNLRHAGIDRYIIKNCTVAITYSAVSGRIEVLSFEAEKSLVKHGS